MPPLADWFNIAAMCLGAANGLEAPAKMSIAKMVGYRVAMVGGLCIGLAFGWIRCRLPDLGRVHQSAPWW
jgi:hypothetical protein